MKLYKLTDSDRRTHGGTRWGEGVTHTATPGDGPLGSGFWIHAYRTPLLAALMNPVHGGFEHPLLWEAEGEVGKDDGTKVGCKKLTTIKLLDSLPKPTLRQRVIFAIFSVRAVMLKDAPYKAAFDKWADGYLAGKKDREAREAAAAEAATAAEAWAEAGEGVARAAAWVAEAAGAAGVMAWAEADAARAVAWVAWAAEALGKNLDIQALAEAAMTHEQEAES